MDHKINLLVDELCHFDMSIKGISGSEWLLYEVCRWLCYGSFWEVFAYCIGSCIEWLVL